MGPPGLIKGFAQAGSISSGASLLGFPTSFDSTSPTPWRWGEGNYGTVSLDLEAGDRVYVNVRVAIYKHAVVACDVISLSLAPCYSATPDFQTYAIPGGLIGRTRPRFTSTGSTDQTLWSAQYVFTFSSSGTRHFTLCLNQNGASNVDVSLASPSVYAQAM